MKPVFDSTQPSGPTVRRWTRYGKDRLYVADGDVKLGWLDLLTGDVTVECPEREPELRAALSAHQGETILASQPVEVPSQQSPAAPPPVVPAVAWTDLAANRPGQGVRAEAAARLADRKAQSKLRTFLERAVDAKTDERAFRVGADGEEAVGARLERLVKRGWRVLHSIPVGERGSDIDHLLIGPGGVYTVNTKNHPGGQVWVGEHSIRVNGHPTHYLRNSRFEARRVSGALAEHLDTEIPVRAVLIILTGTVVPDVTIKQMPDVLVLDRMDVPGVFKRAPERISTEVVERVFEVCRRSSTWLP